MVDRTDPSLRPALPLLVEPQRSGPRRAAALAAWLRDEPEWTERHLDRHGALLFRGFAVDGPEAFGEAATSVSPRLLEYTRGITPRTRVTASGVSTSTDLPARFRIMPHCEMSYSIRYPARLMFYCQTPPREGGETPLFDVRRVYRAIDPRVRDRFAEKGVMIVQNVARRRSFTSRTSWPEMFGTTDRSAVERTCRDLEIDFRWKRGEVLQLVSRQPSAIDHPRTGETVWFNHAASMHVGRYSRVFRGDGLLVEWLAVGLLERWWATFRRPEDYPTNCLYGDGTPIEAETIDHVRDVHWREAALFPWQRGDVLLIDNVLVAHGRMPFRGPRRILAALLGPSAETKSGPPWARRAAREHAGARD